jgi:hypothetical protein
MNEYSLHSEIKRFYSLPGDQFEIKLGNYVIDILSGQLLIEVQTKNFSAIKEKLQTLTKKHQVRLVYPLTENKMITCVRKDNTVVSKRRSPKKGKIVDLFRELVLIPQMICEANFSLEVLMIDEEEVRCDDGKGSWRRRGVSIKERKLMKVNGRILFQNRSDYLKLLPDGLGEVFSNRELARQAKISVETARQMTYCLRKGNIIQIAQKDGAEYRFQKIYGDSP